jgi:hypothetical protein
MLMILTCTFLDLVDLHQFDISFNQICSVLQHAGVSNLSPLLSFVLLCFLLEVCYLVYEIVRILSDYVNAALLL